MKLAGSCRKILALVLTIGLTVAASANASLAAPREADNAEGTDVMLVRVDHCEGIGVVHVSIVGFENASELVADAETAFEPFIALPEIQNRDGFTPCGTVLFLVSPQEPDQNTILPLDAAVWSRGGSRMDAAATFP